MALTTSRAQAPENAPAKPARRLVLRRADIPRQGGPAVTPADRHDALAGVLSRAVQARGGAERELPPDVSVASGPVLQRFVDELWDSARDFMIAMTVRVMIVAGITDENRLTNAAFWYLHPEVKDMKLSSKNPEHVALMPVWIALRDRVVIPELEQMCVDPEEQYSEQPPEDKPYSEAPPDVTPPQPAPAPAPAPSPDPSPTVPHGPASKMTAKEFLATHRGALAKLDECPDKTFPKPSDEELLALLDDTLKHMSAVRVEYMTDSKATTRLPLTQKIFEMRYPGVDYSLLGYTTLMTWWDQARDLGLPVVQERDKAAEELEKAEQAKRAGEQPVTPKPKKLTPKEQKAKAKADKAKAKAEKAEKAARQTREALPIGWDLLDETKPGIKKLWHDMAAIRENLVYPFLRIVTPRIEGASKAPADAPAGERVARQAHAYLGIRYQIGGSYSSAAGADPWDFDPWKEKGTTLDCQSFVFKVFADVGLPITSGEGSKVKIGTDELSKAKKGFDKKLYYDLPGWADQLRNSDQLETIQQGSLQPGDLVFRLRLSKDKKATVPTYEGMHVAIYVGKYGDHEWVIHAPQTGRVVSKDRYAAADWTSFRRRMPK